MVAGGGGGDTVAADVVLITGSAGGIGSATARRFAAGGFAVVGLDLAPLEAAEEAGLSGDAARGGGYTHLIGDVADEAALAAAVEAAASLGTLRHVIGVAGGAMGENGAVDVLDVSLDAFRRSLELNLVSQWALLRAAVGELRRGGGDRSVTFTSSINAVVGIDLHACSAAKAGLVSLARTAAGVLGRDGIRVNALAPGTVRTPRTEAAWAGDPGHFERLDRTCPLGRVGEPGHIAESFFALATVLTHVTGTTLVVDGGQTARWSY